MFLVKVLRRSPSRVLTVARPVLVFTDGAYEGRGRGAVATAGAVLFDPTRLGNARANLNCYLAVSWCLYRLFGLTTRSGCVAEGSWFSWTMQLSRQQW